MRKRKAQISFPVTAKLISAFVFAIRIVQILFLLNPKFQIYSHLHFSWLGSELLVCCLTHRGQLAPELVGYSAPRDLLRRAAYSICESLFLIHQDVYHDLFVCS